MNKPNLILYGKRFFRSRRWITSQLYKNREMDLKRFWRVHSPSSSGVKGKDWKMVDRRNIFKETKGFYHKKKRIIDVLFGLWVAGWISFWIMIYVLRQFYLQWKEERERKMKEEEIKIGFEKILEEIEKDAENVDLGEETFWSRFFRIFRMIYRCTYLSIMFLPVVLTYPLYLLGYDEFWYSVIVFTFRNCGPCFIKLGQWCGTKMEWFPPEFCRAMSALHANGDSHRFSHSKKIIENTLSKSMEEIFVEFDPVPVASGAIAQVYKARLRDGGHLVAVKVRHPGVKEIMVMDLMIVQNFMKLLGKFSTFQWLNLEDNVISFSRDMKAQLNLETEAKNLAKFIKNFEDIPNIDFPSPFVQYCSPEVLVETFEEGIPISEFTELISKKASIATSSFKKQLASLGIVLYLKMLLCDNFLHSDLHPGNIFVRINEKEDESTPSLVILDAGLVCSLSPRDKQNFLDLFLAITQREGRKVAEMMITRSHKYRDITSIDELEPEEREHCIHFINEMNELIEEVIEANVGEMQVTKVMGRVLDIGRKYQVEIEPNFTSLIIASITIEGLAKQLDPLFNFVNEATPVVEKVGTELRNDFLKNKFLSMFEEKFFKQEDETWTSFNEEREK